eukprot:1811310-Amphidinium_carterae.1
MTAFFAQANEVLKVHIYDDDNDDADASVRRQSFVEAARPKTRDLAGRQARPQEGECRFDVVRLVNDCHLGRHNDDGKPRGAWRLMMMT